MIAILCTSRSGSSMVAGIFVAHGCSCGQTFRTLGYVSYESQIFKKYLKQCGHAWKKPRTLPEFIPDLGRAKQVAKDANINLVKCSVEFWPSVKTLKPKLVVKIKRDIDCAARSVSDKRNEKYGHVLPYIRRRYAMLDHIPGVTVNTDALVRGDFKEIRDAFDVAGMKFSQEKALEVINPEMWHYQA